MGRLGTFGTFGGHRDRSTLESTRGLWHPPHDVPATSRPPHRLLAHEPSRVSETVRISRRLAIVNSVAAQVTFVLNVTVLLWMNRYLSARLDANEFNLIPVANALLLLPPLLTEALTNGLGRFIMRAASRGDADRIRTIVSSLVPVLCGVSALIAALGALAVWKIDAVVETDPRYLGDLRWMVAILLTTSVVRLPLAPFLTGFYVKQEGIRDKAIRIATELLRLSLVVLLILVFEARALWLPVGSTAAALVGLSVRFVVSRRLVPELRFSFADRVPGVWREILAFGSWSTLRMAGGRLRNFFTPLLVTNLAGAEANSELFLGSMIQRQAPTAVAAAVGPIGPPMVAMVSRGEFTRVKAAYLNGSRYALTMTALIAMPFLVFHQAFIDIYLRDSRDKFDLDAIGTVMLLSTMMVIVRTSSFLTGALANATGQVRGLAWRTALTQTSALLATALCVGPWRLGPVGAAAGACAVMVILVPTLQFRFCLKLARTSVREWAESVGRPLLRPVLLALGVWFAACELIAPSGWIELGFAFLLGAAVFALFAWTDALRPRERRDVLRAIEKVTERFAPGFVKRRRGHFAVEDAATVPLSRRVEALLHVSTERGREQMRLPHFLVIGAQKSGTTWLHVALSRHPDVFMPEQKELHYFDLGLGRSLHHYTRAFQDAPQEALRGEITPAYAILSEKRIAFVRRVLPDARLVYIMREPVERAWSQVVMELGTRRGRSITEVSDEEIRTFLDSSPSRLRCDYTMTIERWERHYAADRILYGFFEAVGDRAMLERVFSHFGLRTDVEWDTMPLGQVIRPRVDETLPGDHDAAPAWVRELLRPRFGAMLDDLERRFGDRIAPWRR